MPNLFIVDLNYIAPLKLVDRYMKEHMAFIQLCYEKKIFIASGRKQPRTGGIIIARGLTLEQLNTLIEQDPFIKNKLAEAKITEFSASQFQPELKSLL